MARPTACARSSPNNLPVHFPSSDDVPSEVVPQDELLLPRLVRSPEHEGHVPYVIAQIGLRRYPEVLVNEGAPPGVVVRYVGVERLACLTEGKKVGGLEERRDMGE